VVQGPPPAPRDPAGQGLTSPPSPVAESLDDLCALVLSEAARIDHDGVEAVADGAVEEHGRHRRVHAARHRADHLALGPNLLPHLMESQGHPHPPLCYCRYTLT
jgi:hypothetical protein